MGAAQAHAPQEVEKHTKARADSPGFFFDAASAVEAEFDFIRAQGLPIGQATARWVAG